MQTALTIADIGALVGFLSGICAIVGMFIALKNSKNVALATARAEGAISERIANIKTGLDKAYLKIDDLEIKHSDFNALIGRLDEKILAICNSLDEIKERLK